MTYLLQYQYLICNIFDINTKSLWAKKEILMHYLPVTLVSTELLRYNTSKCDKKCMVQFSEKLDISRREDWLFFIKENPHAKRMVQFLVTLISNNG